MTDSKAFELMRLADREDEKVIECLKLFRELKSLPRTPKGLDRYREIMSQIRQYKSNVSGMAVREYYRQQKLENGEEGE